MARANRHGGTLSTAGLIADTADGKAQASALGIGRDAGLLPAS